MNQSFEEYPRYFRAHFAVDQATEARGHDEGREWHGEQVAIEKPFFFHTIDDREEERHTLDRKAGDCDYFDDPGGAKQYPVILGVRKNPPYKVWVEKAVASQILKKQDVNSYDQEGSKREERWHIHPFKFAQVLNKV